jgi:hypothetical protein
MPALDDPEIGRVHPCFACESFDALLTSMAPSPDDYSKLGAFDTPEHGRRWKFNGTCRLSGSLTVIVLTARLRSRRALARTPLAGRL